MVKIQDKLHVANESLEFFKLTEFKFHSKNIDKLLKSMSKEDEAEFEIDVKMINWKNYFQKYVLGIRQHVLKQSSLTIESCRNRMKR